MHCGANNIKNKNKKANNTPMSKNVASEPVV
jgi:hypothetical protein